MNSGYSCFRGIPSQVDYEDFDKLIEEICNEMLSNDERKEMFDKFMNEQQYVNGDLLSCGACGFQELRRGGNGFLPSRVNIKAHFPIEPGFAITIHKAQG